MEKRKVVYILFDGFKRSERPYQILKPKEDDWEEYGKKYSIRGLLTRVGVNFDLVIENNKAYIKSDGFKYLVDSKVLTDLTNYKNQVRKKKERLEQKV